MADPRSDGYPDTLKAVGPPSVGPGPPPTTPSDLTVTNKYMLTFLAIFAILMPPFLCFSAQNLQIFLERYKRNITII